MDIDPEQPQPSSPVSPPPSVWVRGLILSLFCLSPIAQAQAPKGPQARISPKPTEVLPQGGRVLSPYAQGARAVIQRTLAQSALFDGEAYRDWGEAAQALVEAGELFLRSGPLIDAAGVEVAGGVLGQGVARLPQAPEVIFEALGDPAAQPALFEDVLESSTYGRSLGGGAEHWLVYQEIDILGPIDAKAYFRLSARSMGEKGFFIWWEAAPPGMVSKADGDAVAPNMALFSGSWRILPHGEGSLVYYTGITLPAYYLPGWIASQSFVGMRVPGLYEALGDLGGVD